MHDPFDSRTDSDFSAQDRLVLRRWSLAGLAAMTAMLAGMTLLGLVHRQEPGPVARLAPAAAYAAAHGVMR